MNLSPQERQAVCTEMARMGLAEIRAEIGDLSELVVLPLASASQLLGLSPKQTGKLLPLTKTAPGKHGVTLAAIRNHIATHTTAPVQ